MTTFTPLPQDTFKEVLALAEAQRTIWFQAATSEITAVAYVGVAFAGPGTTAYDITRTALLGLLGLLDENPQRLYQLILENGENVEYNLVLLLAERQDAAADAEQTGYQVV